jgi:hypothetical protein
MESSIQQSNKVCCFCEKYKTGNDIPDLRLEIALSGGENVVTWSHEKCFIQLQNHSILPDKPEELGNIPKKAKCVFCGNSLPVIGRHPYCFDVGEHNPPKRYWSHAVCMTERIKSTIIELL